MKLHLEKILVPILQNIYIIADFVFCFCFFLRLYPLWGMRYLMFPNGWLISGALDTKIQERDVKKKRGWNTANCLWLWSQDVYQCFLVEWSCSNYCSQTPSNNRRRNLSHKVVQEVRISMYLPLWVDIVNAAFPLNWVIHFFPTYSIDYHNI